jgi:predicted dinucleotide-binding enzyme
MAIQKIAVLGLGGFGAGVAESLVRAQYHLLAWNPEPLETDLLERQGARMVGDASAATAGAHAVLACLAGRAAQEDLQEIVSSLDDEQVLVVLTDQPQAPALPDGKRAPLFIRVSGSDEDAAEGRLQLTLLKGELPEDIRPVLEVLGELEKTSAAT